MAAEQELQRCDHCDEANRAEARFCDSCGSPLAVTCPACSARLRPQARFCDGCGTPVAKASSETSSPRDYTPRHLADKILGSRSAIEGERKQVTVLFADVKGSMELARAVDAEDWRRILERFFEILTEGVHRFEGTVNQYTGDGIMALFGAPIAHEDHAQRACYASLYILERLAEQAREVKREHNLNFSARIGLNSGDVVVGKIGDDLRMDYTAQGLTVGLAARMEELASHDTIYLSEDTERLVAGYFDLDDLGEFPVKGMNRPVRVHQLRDAGAARTRFDVSRLRGLSRFVGRDADMRALETALEQATASGSGQVVGVVAEAGTGKSRLCFEFIERCRGRGIGISEGRALAHGKNIPFLPMLQVFRDYFGIDERDEPRITREKIAGRLLLLDDEFRDALPLVFELFGVPDPDRPAPDLDPEQRQRQIFGVLQSVVKGDGASRVALLEDLHWMDATSERFLEQWVDAVPNGNGLLLVNFRPEYHADWMQKSWYRQLPLAPLGPEAVQQLLEDLLGRDPSFEGLAARIHERTGGNPFFAEEVVQSLIESGRLEGTRGAYRLVSPVDQLEIPPTVQSLLAARIDRLAESDKHVLQAAAVLGKEFDEPVLAAIAGLPDSDLADALSKLKAGEFVYEAALYPVARYAFKHPLTQEVALKSQLRERRARLHASAARALEEAMAARLDENAALIAHHWGEAGEDGHAAEWHRRAALWIRGSDPVQCIRHWRCVFDHARVLTDDEFSRDLRLQAGTAALAMGSWRLGMPAEEVEELAADARAIAEDRGDTEALVQIAIGQAASKGIAQGDVGRYHQLAREVQELDDESLSIELRINISVTSGYSANCIGLPGEAELHLGRMIELSAGDPQRGKEMLGYSAHALGHTLRGVARAQVGDFDASWRDMSEGLSFSREHELAENLGWALSNLTVLAYARGGAPEGAPDTVRGVLEAMEIADTVGSPFSRTISVQQLGYAQLVAGDLEGCVQGATEAIERIAQTRTGFELEYYPFAARSHARRRLGDLDAAVTDGERAVEICNRLPNWTMAIDANVALVLARLARDGASGIEAAEERLRAADACLEKSGARALGPMIVEARARIAQVQGDSAVQEAHLRSALQLYRAIGAVGHIERLASEI
jgi:class 3 adenylate cyclase